MTDHKDFKDHRWQYRVCRARHGAGRSARGKHTKLTSHRPEQPHRPGEHQRMTTLEQAMPAPGKDGADQKAAEQNHPLPVNGVRMKLVKARRVAA
jgi:hypothetical protein